MTPLRYAGLAVGILLLIGASAWAGYRYGSLSGTTVSLQNNELIFADVSKRVILSRIINNEAGKQQVLVCAEPPPDAAANTTQSLKTLIEATGKSPGGPEGSAHAEADQSKQVAINGLLVRTQGLQNLRDILYRACEAQLNGILNQNDYNQIFWGAIMSTTSLMLAEMMIRENSEANEKLYHDLLTFTQIMVAQPSSPTPNPPGRN
jgi:hypothetical protein